MSVKFKDYYETLGVPRTVSDEEIKRAYRALVRRHHPDLHPEKDKAAQTERVKEINEAYSVLGDKENRAKYDRLGSEPEPPPAGDAPPHGFRPENAEAFSDFFYQFFGGAGAGEEAAPWEAPVSALDVEAEVELTLEEAAHGAEKSFTLRANGACLGCRGTGRAGRGFCRSCGGTGESGRRRQVRARLPSGLHEDSRIRLKGKGNESGGRSGDLYLRVKLAPHPGFRVDGSELETAVSVMPWEAALGGEVSVPTLEGPARVRLPAGTTTGKALLLKGRGLGKSGGGRGDLRARVRIDIPPHLSERARGLFAELAKEAHEPSRAS